MKELTDSVKLSLQNKNWYAALTLALTLPDICAKIEMPLNQSSSDRYSKWFTKYVEPRYTDEIGPDRETFIFLNGNDCYALRCAFLHEGSSNITTQRRRDVLEDFQFTKPDPDPYSIVHCNNMDNRLQLQVDLFCKDIIIGIELWLKDIKSDADKILKLSSLLKISSIR